MTRWALLFDVDGVIADTETLNARATALMFKELYGVTIAPEEFYAYIGMGDERYVQGPAEKHGVAIDTEAAVARRAENFLKLTASGPLPPTPGLLELARQARESGRVTLAIATSGRREKQVPVIEGTGLKLEWFPVFISGEQVTKKKPDPQIYRLAAEALTLPPKRCVVVEDAPAGIQAARAAGMWCLGLTTSASPQTLEQAGADWVVGSLEEVSLETLERRFQL